MKSAIAPAVIASLLSIISTNAGPVPYQLSHTRDILAAPYIRDVEADLHARELLETRTCRRGLSDDELEARGCHTSKEVDAPKKKDSKAMYSVGDNKSETPKGQFRQYTAGRHDDYFGDWQTMTGGKGKSGVDNPAAGKGKRPRAFYDELEARGSKSSKEAKDSKDKDSKAMYSVGDNKSETPTGEFRKYTAGRHDDYFGDWQTMTGGKGKSGVDNPAAGKGKRPRAFYDELPRAFYDELKARGGNLSKVAKDSKEKDSKAMYSVGDNKSETPTGEFRKYTAGRHDDYFGDWQTMTGGKGKSGVDNPAAGKGKRSRAFYDEIDLD
ncbi:hypothetical protein H0H87_004469 [Tephrocybe sp. NHM501043]|nr:hypothetical protein H0H87_004469 [Tephrocybe sp. NHM501043]